MFQSKAQPRSVEKERDELKARLEETERKLKEKTRRVSQLEQNLDEVTKYLLEFKAMIEGSKGDNQVICNGVLKDNVAYAEGSDVTPAESVGGTLDE